MSKIRLHGSSSGYVEIAPAAAASNNTLTAPSTVGEIIAKDAAGAIGVTSVHTTNVVATGTTKVGAAVTISESGIEASGVGITCANINGAAISGRRRLNVNGAMEVAQYYDKVGAITDSGYYAVDRMRVTTNGVDEAATISQSDVASGTSPYTEGFRKAVKIQNGNQTSGAGAADRIVLEHRFEHQDIASSGWNYTSSTSFITVQFWVKSSVAQTYFGRFTSQAGTLKTYPFSFALTADTWTKVVKTIPGHADLSFTAGSVGNGLLFELCMFRGTDSTADSVSVDEWHTYNAATRTPDQTSTWYTTNDATFEVTGLQVEVGSQATAFEHRTYGDELSLCQRYFIMFTGNVTAWRLGHSWISSGTAAYCMFHLPTTMRNIPTQIYTTGTAANYQVHGASSASTAGTQIVNCNAVPTIHTQSTRNLIQMGTNTAGGLITGRAAWFRSAASTVYIGIGAELA